MRECITIINQKGGVAKTTTANNLGAGLYLKGFRVLYIDLDSQQNLSYTLGARTPGLTIYDVLTGEATAREAILKTEGQGDFIPASQNLARENFLTGKGREYRLKEAIEPLKEDYDYILLDTPPSLGILTINALTASDSAIIPATAELYSLQGIGQLSQTVQAVKQYLNPALKVKGILLTQYKPRTILSRDMTDLMEDTARQLSTKVFNTRIRTCNALSETNAVGKNIFTYSPRSNAGKDYMDLVEEILAG